MSKFQTHVWYKTLGALVLLLIATMIAAGCGSQDDDKKGDTRKQDKISQSEWATYGYNYQNTRHVPFDQITPENVKDLGVAFVTDFQKEGDDSIPGGQQSNSLMIDGKLYVTTHYNHIFALDAKTGEEKWHYIPDEIGAFKNFGVSTNRGAAYCDGSIFMLTLDMRIIKVDASTGKEQKVVEIKDAVDEADAAFGYYETTAPICHDNILVIGSSGADNGVRGFVMAYNAKDLSPAWDSPHWNVPPEGEDWRSKGRFHGGGTTWAPVTIDPDEDIVYFSTANPSPDFFANIRPGKNPKTNSVIAVELETGKELWWAQQLGPDEWDYDTAQPPVLFETKEGQKVVSVATKQGVWFMYDAKTGDVIHEKVQVIDKLDHPRLKPGKPVDIYPSALGGVNSAPASYDPKTGYNIVNVVESKATLIQVQSEEDVYKDRVRGDVDTGAVNGFGETPKGWKDYGTIRAIDTQTGKVAWRVKVPEPERGGTTTTASGLAFAGGGDGVLRAMDTKTGKVLWQFQTGAQIASAPVMYELDGDQYVAVTIGGTFTSSLGGRVSKIMVFKLGGDKKEFEAPQTVAEQSGKDTPPAENPSDRSPLAQYLKLDATGGEKAVELVLIGAEGAKAGGMNFNGYSRGEMVVSIPKGWSVKVTFKNKSAQVPHSVMVTKMKDTEKTQGFEPAFEDAFTKNPTQGITSGTQFFTFTADNAGKFALLCAVPGHAVAGMWDTLEITEGGKPTITAGGETYTIEEAKS